MRSEKPLGDVLAFSNGKTSPPRTPNGEYRVFGSNGIIGRAGKANSPENTIVIGRVGSYCGSVHFSDAQCWVTDNAIRANPKGGNNPFFLYHMLRTLGLNKWSSGSGQPLLNQTTLRSIRVRIPSIHVQNSIAELLHNFDLRIEILKENSRTLESIAQAIFKSWFIDFDPVHTKAAGQDPIRMDAETAMLFPSEFENSELGPIPKGWRFLSLDDAVELNPRRDLAKGTVAPYLDMANTPLRGHRPENIVERAMGSGVRFMNGDTLLARITPSLENGKTAFVDFLQDGQVGWGSTEFIVMKPKEPLPSFFGYLLAREPAFRAYAVQTMTGSSGRQRVDLRGLSEYKVAIPDAKIATAFGDFVEPFRSRIAHASEQAQTLAALRDTLLPRLISGRLRIPEAEQIVEEAVS